ncbi:MAG: hypothetical protein U5L45_00455 [Saprospiraceae bacterium]|nr:hypothetical protein [Saprospiraceae bacterium]
MTELKPLPRQNDGNFARKFTANGINYKILSVNDAMSIERYTEFSRLSAVVGFGADFNGLLGHLDQIAKDILLIDSKEPISKLAAIARIQAVKDAVIDTSKERFNQAMYFCSLFIVRDGEDLTRWDFEDATEKISDWNTEGYKGTDFFSLAALCIPDFAVHYLQTEKEVKSRTINTLLGTRLLTEREGE